MSASCRKFVDVCPTPSLSFRNGMPMSGKVIGRAGRSALALPHADASSSAEVQSGSIFQNSSDGNASVPCSHSSQSKLEQDSPETKSEQDGSPGQAHTQSLSVHGRWNRL